MPSEEKNKRAYSAKKRAKIKLRRHELYKLVSAEKGKPYYYNGEQKDKSQKGVFLSLPLLVSLLKFQQSTLNKMFFPQILPLFSQQPMDPHGHSSPTGFDKRKLLTSPLHTFEVGSTSTAPQAAFRQTCNTTSALRKKDSRSCKTSCSALRTEQSDYVPLKVVPNCKFCAAKRFKYEPPGFCCRNGSIKLVSHETTDLQV